MFVFDFTHLKSLLIMKGQKHNRGARKMNLFTSLVELWPYDSRKLCSKKNIFCAPLWPPISLGSFKRWAKVIYSQFQLVLHYFPSMIENRKWKDSWKNICITLQSHCVDFTVPDPFPSYAISFWQDVNMLYFSGLGNIHIWCQVYFQPFTSDILRLS